ncbi:MAG: hypothetical protein COT43_09010 [Candidatus Marinimicrobia bacterium CG08_land_8_20_14_0_20_45_22]|nr:MAG: hypothetical protein COT43_09010 [Candidatus Marinimicrobia bacterium CG08_land_8_20_14_0_20_45_22]
MTLEEIRTNCQNLKGARKDFPFDDKTLLFKIGSKMSALISLNAKEIKVNLKGEFQWSARRF